MTSIEETSAECSAVFFEACANILPGGCVVQDKNLDQIQANILHDREEMALALVNESLTQDPHNLNLQAYKAYLLYLLDENAEALKICNHILIATNEIGVSSDIYQIPKGFIHAVKASILLDADDHTPALEALNKAIQQENHPFYSTLRACIYFVLEDFNQAISDATDAINRFNGYSIFSPDRNEAVSEMYAIRAISSMALGLDWEDDFRQAISLGSEILQDF
jgi:tetratricopeptide (TPR) repeat protein